MNTSQLNARAITSIAVRLPNTADEEIRRCFESLPAHWESERIVRVKEAQLDALLMRVLSGDSKEGFKGMSYDHLEKLNVLQFNTLNSQSALFRGHRIARSSDGLYSVFGHGSMYRHIAKGNKSPWWKFWK